MRKQHLFTGLLLLGTAFWGISFTGVKVGISHHSAFVFLFYKFLLAALALAGVFYRQLRYISRTTWRVAALISAPLLVATVLQTLSLRYTSVTNAAFITGLDVVLIPVLKFLVYKKPVQPKHLLACGLALIGLYIITVQHGLHLTIGDLGMVACAVGFAFYVLQVGHVSREPHPMPSVILLMGLCALGCGLMALLEGVPQWVPQDRDFWTGALFAALPATAYMYAVQNLAQRHLAEEQVALTYLFEPLFATLAGVVVLGEPFTSRIVLGGSFIVGAMLLAELDLRKLLRRR